MENAKNIILIVNWNLKVGYSTFVTTVVKVDNDFLSFKGILISERLSPHTGYEQSSILNREFIISFILLYKVNFSNVIGINEL